jgi:hypothetical protein
MYSSEVLLLAVMVAIVVGIALYARAVGRVMPVPRAPAGIGGWLILPAISLVLGPLGALYALSQLAPILSQFTPGSIEYTIILFEAVSQGTIGAFAIFCAYQFFSLSRLTPGLMIALYAAFGAFAVVNGLIRAMADGVRLFDTVAGESVIGALLAALTWIPYFTVSVRVRNTFTR